MGGGQYLIYVLYLIVGTSLNPSLALRRWRRQVTPITLYSDTDPLVQLTGSTFDSEVYNSGHAHLIEFYMSWCGHCRAYVPIWVQFAQDVQKWNKIVKIGAINCALESNKNACIANDIHSVPYVKYFPRNAPSPAHGVGLEAYRSVPLLRKELAGAIRAEYNTSVYQDWPNFEFLPDSVNTLEVLWDFVSPDIRYIALVFENDSKSTTGVEVSLDLSSVQILKTFLALDDHPLALLFQLNEFPTIVVLQKDNISPVYQSELRQLLVLDLLNLPGFESPYFTKNATSGLFGDRVATTTTPRPATTTPESDLKLKAKYYVSETDLLLAMRYALYEEVPYSGRDIFGRNYTALMNFLDALRRYYPLSVRTRQNLWRLGFPVPSLLPQSSKARSLFADLYDWLHSDLDQRITPAQWKQRFTELEQVHGHPFPDSSADWQHCKGSRPEFRGYTCGLWENFHALTIHAYVADGIDNIFYPLPVLLAIRGYVENFFGCTHCAQHFLRMADETLNMTLLAQYPSDVIMWLWRAHNEVNRRLAGDSTEDPKFIKRQFPPQFLCPTCWNGQEWNPREVLRYLISYYTNILPDQTIAVDKKGASAQFSLPQQPLAATN